MSKILPRLRMNQGDRTEGRIYFAPHFIAQRLNLFEGQGIAVDFLWSEPGDFLAKSGQIPPLLRGEADLTIGGPMVTMRMRSEGSADLVCFCAAVQANPWFLAVRPGSDPFRWQALAGHTILDVSRITTATLCFEWLLRRQKPAAGARLIEGSGDESADIARLLAGEVDFVLHSLHGLAPWVARGEIAIATSLASATGPVPWSAYIAVHERFEANRDAYAAFARAIGGAFAYLAHSSAATIAALIAEDFPLYPRAALEYGIARYKDEAIWPTGTIIPKTDYQRFHDILRECHWFEAPVAYEDQVVADLA